MIKTITVVTIVSRRVGQVTLLNLCADFLHKCKWVGHIFLHVKSVQRSQTQTNRLWRRWQEWRDSNPRPPVLETGALPVELHS